MTQRYQVYKCKICGGIVEVLVHGGNDLICCGAKMELLDNRTEDVGKEKHVPVVEKTDNGIKIKVGSFPHPMEEKHYIEWIEAVWDGRTYIKFQTCLRKFCIYKLDIFESYFYANYIL